MLTKITHGPFFGVFGLFELFVPLMLPAVHDLWSMEAGRRHFILFAVLSTTVPCRRATLMASSATMVFPAPVSAKTIKFSSAARAAACDG